VPVRACPIPPSSFWTDAVYLPEVAEVLIMTEAEGWDLSLEEGEGHKNLEEVVARRRRLVEEVEVKMAY